MRALSVVSSAVVLAGWSTGAPSAEAPREGYLPGAGGVKLFYRVLGTGRPVIVVHGGPGGSMRNLLPDLQPLATNHRLIFYDQRGGGRSDLPADKSLLDAKYFVEDLEQVRRFFGRERVTLLAHSFGPVLAARYLEAHPRRVDRAVFMGAIGPRVTDAYAFAAERSSRMPAEARERLKEIVRKLQGEEEVDRQALCREMETLEPSTRPPESPPGDSNCNESKEAVDYSFRNTSRITFASFGKWDYTRSLRGVRAPLLVVYGDRDPSPLSSQEAWAAAVPNGRLLVVRDAGHGPHVDRPQEVFEAIRTFLAGGWPSAARRVEIRASGDPGAPGSPGSAWPQADGDPGHRGLPAPQSPSARPSTNAAKR